ncbi:TlpA family protein disulfide reductase [Candidatus Lucifugimonas marina]|jgi:hypothetical protein|uniref:Thioredoxin domain-containing protein n=1 Tax=Candidatus Lucifugimonas marina TaxID=3038979 RepID=A0AAJ5ZG86_9CHLR|nr:hypothetical protein [SAR202 cluster bacterium JH702]MDG0870776.1 hypothetical protein [SAR202 cluster bacterium JH639]WFG36502.1 hypothetical protein GKN94_12700 [SAR202 cluster bacterium JH545]WFG40435.1 hypothetical protein GKO48_12735 [SAR202 cluster bacterium JH1073]
MPALARMISRLKLAPLVFVGLLTIALVACSSDELPEVKPPDSRQTSVQESGLPNALSSFAEPEPRWTVVSDEINLELATPDLGVGVQRFGIVLSDDSGLIKFPIVKLTSNYYPDGYDNDPIPEISTSGLARFYLFPFGTRGIHSTDLQFDRAGLWSVSADIPRPDGTTEHVEVRFPVAEKAQSVTVGQNAPASESRTLESTGDIAKLTTGSQRDAGLYEYSIAEALQREKPLLIVFASPAFCTNAVCGPQVEIASELREIYGDQVDFVHVDLYSNPHEIQGDLSKARLTPILEEWGLSSQEWTFIVDSNGIVTYRFENFAPKPELIEALDETVAMG